MSISSSSVLVELNLCVWPAVITDKAETEKVNQDNHAGRKAAQVKKNLMAGTKERKNIANYAAGCRVWHNSRSLPWAQRGPRLLPTSLFMDYKTEANQRKAQFEQMVDTFVDNYPALVQIAQYNSEGLGRMFNPADYPDQQTVRDMFGFTLSFSPVPESGDFRLDVPAQELEEVKNEYDETFGKKLQEAMREPWERLHGLLKTTSEKLTDKDGDETKRYHDTLITNAQDLCGLLGHLNVTRDPLLERARREVEAALCGADIDVIKDSPEVRLDLKAKVDGILKQYEW